jgi:hypothetical protein
VTLEILDGAGKVVRRYSSEDKVELPAPEAAPLPMYWYRPPQVLKATAGMHRFMWDMRWQPLPGGGGRGGLPMAAIAHNTAPAPNSIWVAPGSYTVRLTVNGKALTQPITVKMDPRVKTAAVELARQHELSEAMYDGVIETQAALQKVRDLRAQVKKIQEKAGPAAEAVTKALADFDKKAAALEGGAGGAGGRGGGGGQMAPGGPGGPMAQGGPGGAPGGAGMQDSLAGIGGSLVQLMNLLQAADAAPTTQAIAAVTERREALRALTAKWDAFRTKDVTALNTALKAANLPLIEL